MARSRAVILARATDAFLAEGYERTNVAEVAAAAGVARRTVYNVFGGKEGLFRAVLVDAIEIARDYSRRLVDTPVDDAEPADVLAGIARDLATSIVGGRVIALRRLLIAEVQRFPYLAREYYDQAPGLVMRTLAETLTRFDQAGVLAIDDPVRAGEQFAFLTIGATLDAGLFEHRPGEDVGAEAMRRADDGVEVFLRAYAAG